MAVTEGRFNTLKSRVNEVAERLAKLEGGNGSISQARPKGLVAWLPLGGPVAALIAIVVTAGIHLDNKLGAVQKDVREVGLRLVKQEDAIKVLSSQQNDQTQKLIHDFLAAAKISANPTMAAKAVQAATSLIAALQVYKRPANPQFFEDSTQEITTLLKKGKPELKTVAFGTQRQLAEYRSAILPVPAGGFDCKGSSMRSSLGAGGDKSQANRFVSGIIVRNCPQTLDSFTWENVTFINSRITYHGGPVILKNVIFINCTFATPLDDDGLRLLKYAALDEKSLKVKPELIQTAAARASTHS